MVVALAASLLASGPAYAQDPGDFTIQPEIMLEAAGGYRTNGVGAPTVVWDSNQSRYLMVFETRLPIDDANCPVGVWGLGIASSTDGINWTPSSSAILSPAAGSFYSCVAAHPTAVYDPSTRALYVFFKSEQGTDACDDGEPSWGCGRFTGVGRMRVAFDLVGAPSRITVLTSPVIDVRVDMGFPKFVQKGATKFLLLSRNPEVLVAQSAIYRDFTLTEDPILEPGLVTWGEDEMFNPSIICQDSISFPIAAYPGGRNLDVFAITGAGWGKAINRGTVTTPADWFLGDDTYFEWDNDSDWRHWEVTRLVDDEYLVYYSEKDGAGRPRIRLATTTPSWSGSDFAGKVCP